MLTFDDNELVGAVRTCVSQQEPFGVDRIGTHLISFGGRTVVQGKIGGQGDAVR